MVGHSERPTANLILYPRHFLLLCAFGVALAVITRLHFLGNLDVSFAVYGALHAAALVLSLKAHPSVWRQCLFIVLAAGLCVLTLHVGMRVMHLLGGLPGNVGVYMALGTAAWTGAMTYGISMRLWRIHRLTFRALAVIGSSSEKYVDAPFANPPVKTTVPLCVFPLMLEKVLTGPA